MASEVVRKRKHPSLFRYVLIAFRRFFRWLLFLSQLNKTLTFIYNHFTAFLITSGQSLRLRKYVIKITKTLFYFH